MSQRHFAEVTVRDEGQVAQRYRLTCGSCGCGEALGRMNFGSGIAQEQVPKKFEDKGWRVGKRHDGRDDLCPACLNREQEARRNKIHAVTTKEADVNKASTASGRIGEAKTERGSWPDALKSSTHTADAPREMTREHRRLIFLKLEEVYLDERLGYSAGWTDERVAADLGIPRAWVSTIRDENFGPNFSEELKLAIEAAKALTLDKEDFRKEIEALSAKGSEILKRVDQVDRIVKRIEASIR
ncbi:hypothetical protein [Methylobacterium thuringiense]|uniref:HTH cro/C1-type domain-containing protein n=1 Tax=Methylobacterium thuringiense TaxID=1003091 RepID=A0ABQ4TLI4_9HYPH|nr:hypothetical protein [Methylobacterium thuringiense]GJE54560.1 hypothetical protein EKPJFOCH_1038 [Methylobacterium thuringiense]